MDEVIWIEVLARPREVVLRQRVHGPLLTLGRAYDNDIVLDDPYVAPHHVRLSRGADGNWNVEDLRTVNGIRIKGKRCDCAVLDGNTTVQVGQTSIRLRSSAYQVPLELLLSRARARWPIALGCLTLLLGLALLQAWLGQTGEFKPINYLAPLLRVAGVVLVWTAAWSVMSRILTGRAQYGRHLLIASAGLLIYAICDQLADMGAFALSRPVLAAYGFAIMWLILALVCFRHLRALGPSRLLAKAVCVLALAGLGVGMQGLELADARTNSGQPASAVLKQLEPPGLRLVQPRAESAFLADAARLKPSLDRARTQALPPGSDDNNDSNDD